jgi:hypothetical protein
MTKIAGSRSTPIFHGSAILHCIGTAGLPADNPRLYIYATGTGLCWALPTQYSNSEVGESATDGRIITIIYFCHWKRALSPPSVILSVQSAI